MTLLVGFSLLCYKYVRNPLETKLYSKIDTIIYDLIVKCQRLKKKPK